MRKRMNGGWVLAASTLVLAGCTAQAADRAGGHAGTTVKVLTLAQANDGVPAQVTSWADQVQRLSRGTLSIEFKEAWRSGEPTAEAGIVDDVASGKVDMAWTGARVFDRVGVRSFQPLVAPLLIDSQALQAKVFSSGIVAKMVKGIDSEGLVGLGALPGPMRKVLGVTKPFVRPEDFIGQTVGLQDGAVAETTLRALGATPKKMPSGAHLDGLGGYEQQLASIWGNHYERTAKYVTSNVNLWPRPLVLFASRKVVASLTPLQRSALRNAAAASLPATLKDARTEDADAVPHLCQGGMTFTSASAQDLHAMQTAVRPVYDALDADPTTRAVIEEIQGLKMRLGTAPDAATCSGQEAGSTASSPSAIPDGTYQATLTDAEARRCAGDATNLGGLLELELRHGAVQQYEQRGATPRILGWLGSYRIFRDRFELTEASSGHRMTARWTFDGSQLSLTDLQNGGCDDATVWTRHPWVLKRASGVAPARPEGIYRTTVTAADWRAKRLVGKTGEFTLAFTGHTVTLTEPDGALGFTGTFALFRDRIKVVTPPDTLTATWAVRGNRLQLEDVTSASCVDCGPYAVVLGSHPWQRTP